ncbi:MAG TPA: hypothetical protein VJH03_23660 [Blastocatellia bacterium]|nr:hypothetical protein [Blastocatellia bacterium]
MSIENQPQQPSITKPQPVVDQQQLEMLKRQKRDNQNLLLGALGGLGGALAGAAIWAGITAVTDYQIGWMAVGVGFLVGLSVRKLGQGIDVSFGIVGAGLSLLGCVLGNLFVICTVLSRVQGAPFFQVLFSMDSETMIRLMKVTFSPIDLLFYGIAVYEGFKVSIVRITEADVAKFMK